MILDNDINKEIVKLISVFLKTSGVMSVMNNVLKSRYPNQLYALCKVKLTSTNPTYLCSIISDHGLIPQSFTFKEGWPHTVNCIAEIRVPTYELPKPLDGDWSGNWIHIEFLSEDEELIQYAKDIHHVATNGANNSFITQNRNNERPSVISSE